MATERRIPPNAGLGRPKGVPNKATTEFRVTVQKLLDRNTENVAIWLEQVATGNGDPDKALDLLAKLAEYAAPKLARTEHVGDGGGPVRIIAGPLDESL
jgi:hypothetical protein